MFICALTNQIRVENETTSQISVWNYHFVWWSIKLVQNLLLPVWGVSSWIKMQPFILLKCSVRTQLRGNHPVLSHQHLLLPASRVQAGSSHIFWIISLTAINASIYGLNSLFIDLSIYLKYVKLNPEFPTSHASVSEILPISIFCICRMVRTRSTLEKLF